MLGDQKRINNYSGSLVNLKKKQQQKKKQLLKKKITKATDI